MIKITSLLKLPLICSFFFLPASLVIAESESTQISFFRASPRLVHSNTSFSGTDIFSRYNFKIDIPVNAENSLSKIVINQQSNLETIEIDPEKTKVFILTENGEIPVDNLTDIIVDDHKNVSEIAIHLSESIPSGSKMKIVLRARNPLHGGIYQIVLTFTPVGINPRS